MPVIIDTSHPIIEGADLPPPRSNITQYSNAIKETQKTPFIVVMEIKRP